MQGRNITCQRCPIGAVINDQLFSKWSFTTKSIQPGQSLDGVSGFRCLFPQKKELWTSVDVITDALWVSYPPEDAILLIFTFVSNFAVG